MRQIANSTNNHCVERAISVMRISLGYETGLPENWPMNIVKTPLILVQLSALAFPNHQVKVWENVPRNFGHGSNVKRMGEEFSDFTNWDNCLSGFSYYGKKRDNTAHMVIGDPCIYPDMNVCFIVAVELKEN